MRLLAFRDDDRRPALLTPWTLVHVASGIGAYVMWRTLFPRVRLGTAAAVWFACHLAYEAKDFYRTYVRPKPGGYMNSWQNSVGDQTAGVLGFLLAAYTNMPMYAVTLTVFLLYGLLVSSLLSADGKGTSMERVWSTRG